MQGRAGPASTDNDPSIIAAEAPEAASYPERVSPCFLIPPTVREKLDAHYPRPAAGER